MSASYSTPVLPESKSRNCRMSVPETNARPPAPRSTSTRMSSSASISSQWACSASYIANVIALCACGRLNVITAVAPRRSYSSSASPAMGGVSARSGTGGGAGRGQGRLALGAHAPERHLGLVDEEAGGLAARGEARSRANDAVDVVRRAARAADHVVVVVADARLVAGGAARRLDPPQQADARHRVQAVVYGLRGDRPERLADAAGDRVGVRVAGQLADGAQDRDPRGRGAQSVIAQLLGEILGGCLHEQNRTGRCDRSMEPFSNGGAPLGGPFLSAFRSGVGGGALRGRTARHSRRRFSRRSARAPAWWGAGADGAARRGVRGARGGAVPLAGGPRSLAALA